MIQAPNNELNFLPRPVRLNLSGIPQHITQRGNNRQVCFFGTADYELYLALLAVACERHRCAVHAYVLMTNHVHLLMTPETAEGISLVIRDLGRDYVRQINKAYGRSGTLWEGRFKSSLVAREDYCLACHRYIETNPVRAKMAASPADYRWSSFRANALGIRNDLITTHECLLSLGATEDACRTAYRGLFEHNLEEEWLTEIRDSVRKGLPTGNDRFKRQIEAALSVKLGSGKRGRPAKIIQ
jgi:putative transposase